MCGLNGIQNYCGTHNPGGLLLIEYLPIPYVDKGESNLLHSYAQEFTGAISYSGEWLKAYCLPNDRTFTDKQVHTEQGVHYEREVAGVVPFISPELIAELEKMKQFRFLVRITDRNRNRYMLNDWNSGMEFTSDMTSSNSAQTGQRTTISFKGVLSRQSYINQA